MNYQAARGLKIRMLLILVGFGMAGSIVVARAVQIQILQAPKLKELARRQLRHTVEIQAKRGDIYDAGGEPLALSREEAQVYARPEEVEDLQAAAQKLHPILGLPLSELLSKLSSPKPFVWLSRSASLDQARAITKLDLKGIGILPANRRFYPGGKTGAHLLGFTNIDGKGLEGVEYFYDHLLAGSTIRIWLERDALGNAIFLSDLLLESQPQAGGENPLLPPELAVQEEARGAHLQLTIIRALQYAAESELEKGVTAAGASGGCILVMEPSTGRILAAASWPRFDPNRFREYTQEYFRHRCFNWVYEPGSTFKAFTVAGALEEGVIKPTDTFDCENGFYPLGGYTIKDINPYGRLSVEEIIIKSSNIGASKIGEKMQKERMYRTYRAFGFGEKTSIDFPGESSGLLRHHKEWSAVAIGTISFGQGVAVTPLQTVTALSAIANRGVMMKPYLVEKAILPDGTEKILHSPTTLRRVLTPETAHLVTNILKKVVSNQGTGAKAAVPGFTVAGKTGTAQKAKENARGYEPGKYVASFMGFLPADRPALAMIVVIDEPTNGLPYGGLHAAPVFQSVAKQAMVILGVPTEESGPRISLPAFPKSPAKSEKTDPQQRIAHWTRQREWNPGEKILDNGQVVVPGLYGLSLREALRRLNSLPVAVEVEGSGIVVEVSPAPGSLVPPGDVIHLRVEIHP